MIEIRITRETAEAEAKEFERIINGGAAPASIYDDVDELQRQVAEINERLADVTTDTGWIDIPLASGITAYSEEQAPRCRKIGKDVFLSGVLRGVTAKDQTVATLPVGFRPSKKVMFAVCSVGQMFTKMTVNTNGTIVLNRSSIEPVEAINWHSIACDFSSN